MHVVRVVGFLQAILDQRGLIVFVLNQKNRYSLFHSQFHNFPFRISRK